MTATDIATVARIGRRQAPALAAEEYRRLASLAAALAPDEWARSTDCPGWTVRDVLAHVAGTMAGTSLREGSRQRRVAGARAASSRRPFLDEMNARNIEERAARTEDELVGELRDRIGPAVRARRRVPGCCAGRPSRPRVTGSPSGSSSTSS